MKNTWKALLYLIVSALIYKFIGPIFKGNLAWLGVILWIFVLWGFGYLLSPMQKSSPRWLGKVIIALVMVFLVGLRLDIFVIQELNTIMNTLGLTRAFQDLLIVYCAWVFFQV